MTSGTLLCQGPGLGLSHWMAMELVIWKKSFSFLEHILLYPTHVVNIYKSQSRVQEQVKSKKGKESVFKVGWPLRRSEWEYRVQTQCQKDVPSPGGQ